jgi:hypothetical protein
MSRFLTRIGKGDDVEDYFQLVKVASNTFDESKIARDEHGRFMSKDHQKVYEHLQKQTGLGGPTSGKIARETKGLTEKRVKEVLADLEAGGHVEKVGVGWKIKGGNQASTQVTEPPPVKVVEQKPVITTPRREQPAISSPPSSIPPERVTAEHHAAVMLGVEHLAGEGGLTSIHALQEHTGLPLATLHKAIDDLTRQRKLTGSNIEGRGKVDPKIIAAAIDVHGDKIGYVGKRQTENALDRFSRLIMEEWNA